MRRKKAAEAKRPSSDCNCNEGIASTRWNPSAFDTVARRTRLELQMDRSHRCDEDKVMWPIETGKSRYMGILIVEDDFISRNILKKMLVEMGQSVVEAENGQQGWEILNSENIKLVISDWMMPGMNGLELCKRIRSESFKKYIYVIMLTAKDRRADLMEVFRAGADDYIPKPFDPEELRARVMTGLRVIDLEKRHNDLAHTIIESRNKLRIVIDSLKEEIVSLDRQMRIVSVNKAFASKNKCDPQELVGKDCGDQRDPTCDFLYDDGIRSLIEDVFEKAAGKKTMFTSTDAQGLTVYRQIQCMPVQNESGKVFQVVVVSQDVTEERRKAEEIQDLNEQLLATSAKVEARNTELKNTLRRLEETQTQMIQSEKMASIGQLAAGVAHEINNPTGFVSSNLKTLLDYQQDIAELIGKYQSFTEALKSNGNFDGLSDAIQEGIQELNAFENDIDIQYIMEDITDLIGDCREGTDRIKKIVLDLKDFAHPGEDKIQSLDINSGLESTLNVVNNEIKYKATVTKEFGDIPTIKGYPQQLNQVFMNILVNAAQAIEKKGEIVIRTSLVESQVEVKISDTGCGIPGENLQKIFDPFFTTKDVGKGTGLGMNIAYNIIKKHQGTIAVDSQVGEGTTFTIRLPVSGFGEAEASE
jgi:two-component system NtrC family sensor kinase